MNIFTIATENEAFRRILWTHKHLQMGVLRIQSAQDLEWEQYHGETIVIVFSGDCLVNLDTVQHQHVPGDAIIIPGGVPFNIVNEGQEDLRCIVFYSPPAYEDGAVHGGKTAEIMDPYKRRESSGL